MAGFDALKDEPLQLLKELIGIEDTEKRITEGDIVACIWTVVGFVPWGKVAKKIPVSARLVSRWGLRSRALSNDEEAAITARGNLDAPRELRRAGQGE